MSKFQVNIRDVFNSLLAWFLRTNINLAWFFSIAKGIQTTADNFYSFYTTIRNRIHHTGQTIYLERWLNSIFDPVNQGIYILNVNPDYLRLYNAAETIVGAYGFNLWDSGTTYAADEFAVVGNVVYQSLQNANTNKDPLTQTAWWSEYSTVEYMYNEAEDDTKADFIVYVPAALSYDANRMQGEVERYKEASKNYTILTY